MKRQLCIFLASSLTLVGTLTILDLNNALATPLGGGLPTCTTLCKCKTVQGFYLVTWEEGGGGGGGGNTYTFVNLDGTLAKPRGVTRLWTATGGCKLGSLNGYTQRVRKTSVDDSYCVPPVEEGGEPAIDKIEAASIYGTQTFWSGHECASEEK
jgi:hypothetical protein